MDSVSSAGEMMIFHKLGRQRNPLRRWRDTDLLPCGKLSRRSPASDGRTNAREGLSPYEKTVFVVVIMSKDTLSEPFRYERVFHKFDKIESKGAHLGAPLQTR